MLSIFIDLPPASETFDILSSAVQRNLSFQLDGSYPESG
jgi:hypothetical protein